MQLGNVIEELKEVSKDYHDETINVHMLTLSSLHHVFIDGEKHPLREAAQQTICSHLGPGNTTLSNRYLNEYPHFRHVI